MDDFTFLSLQIIRLPSRCPARVRTYTKGNKVDIINVEHNHPLHVSRRQTGEGSKYRKKTRSNVKNTAIQQ